MQAFWQGPIGVTLGVVLAISVPASSSLAADIPDPILLWPEGAPGAKGDEDVDKPAIWLYAADEPNGAAERMERGLVDRFEVSS